MSELRKRSQQNGECMPQQKRTRFDDRNDDEHDPSAVDEVHNDEPEKVRNGKLLRMVVKNFMCYRHMVFEFNKCANLLIGKNGSGKSAIVAALTVGLGCNAMQTNRGTNLKDLIKHGESQAVIEIHLENSNFDSYEREQYGDRIIIQRTLNVHGPYYMLKNANGQTISTSRYELQKILLAFNIQVDNPICVLNQDLARSLLKDSDESKQYMFFAKATQIDTIKQKLNQCAVIAEKLHHTLSLREKSLEYLHKEVETLEEKYLHLEVTERLTGKLKKLQAQLAWLSVAEQERKLDEVDQELEKLRSSIEEKELLIANSGALCEQTNRTVQMLLADIEEKKLQFSTLKAEHVELRQAMQDTLVEQANIERLKQSTSDKLGRIQEEIVDVELELENWSQSHVSQEKETEEMVLRERQEELSEQIDQIEEELEKMHTVLMELNDTRAQCRHERLAKRSKVMRLEEELEQLKEAPDNKLACYGHNMPALDAHIHQLYREGKFSELPRGPLGQYIEVRDRKWASIVEVALGRLLLAFFVATSRDRKTLNELLLRKYPNLSNCPIITGRFVKQLYDVEQGCVQEINGTHLLMNLIKVTDPVVMNRLIDSAAIDTILVTEQQSIAIQLTSEVENVPENLSKVIAREQCSEFYPQPQYRSYSRMSVPPSRYLQVNKDEHRHRMEQLYKAMCRELEQLKVSENEAYKAYKKQTRRLCKREEHLSKLRKAIYEVERRLDMLASSTIHEEPEERTLRWELEALQTESMELREKLETEQETLQATQSEVLDAKQAVLEKKKAMADNENMIRALQLRIKDELRKREVLQANEQVKRQELQRCEDVIRERISVRSALAEAVERARTEALTTGSPVDTTEVTVEGLKQQIYSTEKRLRKMMRTSGNIEDVQWELDLKTNELEETKHYTEMLRGIISLLNKTRESRYAYLNKLISHMSLRVKHKFKTIMQLGHFARKKIHIDCEAETLKFDVVPRATNTKGAVCTTDALSGGERSYTTVAFLIALWSCVDTPFFILDEYDVFTDRINRHFITQLLLDEAKKKPDRQFCFLTPQEADGLTTTSSLTIHRFLDPECDNSQH
ncbi:structural maintenance of chromosomes protein 6-like [Anopheles aquasalis]|uniref:structural maintenance of chromosomes protein 6-like n=1 Tax=Anopheles aquasalis TaxID=42839 RepID=UPI00215B4A34|nr:structural maintenance of chromosomes protein 6-like [Anopheles aquasalis]